jgi:hypothetical protein
MKADADNNKVRDAINGYYNSVGYNCIVTKIMYDAEDAETSDKALTVKAVFEIKLDRLITGVSADAITVAKASSKSEITIEHNVVVSGAPISGSFKVRCINEFGEFSLS